MQIYILVFRSKALQFPDDKFSSSVKISVNTDLHFTRGPIEYGIFQRITPPVTLVGSIGDEILKAVPVKVTFPEGQNYIGIQVSVPDGKDQDFLDREIGMAITVTTLLLGTSHFLECLNEGWAAFQDHGQISFTLHAANPTLFVHEEFVDSYKKVNEYLCYQDIEHKDRVGLMARWYSKSVRELESTEDRFLYFWTVLEIAIEGRRPFARLLLEYLHSNILPQYSQEEINNALQIGRMHGTRSKLYHAGNLEWNIQERGMKFKCLGDICSEILRFELGIPLKNELDMYFNVVA